MHAIKTARKDMLSEDVDYRVGLVLKNFHQPMLANGRNSGFCFATFRSKALAERFKIIMSGVCYPGASSKSLVVTSGKDDPNGTGMSGINAMGGINSMSMGMGGGNGNDDGDENRSVSGTSHTSMNSSNKGGFYRIRKGGKDTIWFV